MKILAVIPARGGSKGIPGKNLARVGGKPLLRHAIAAARGARLVNRVIVDTDHAGIGRAARRFGAETPYRRPSSLATDRAPMIDVLRNSLRELRRIDGYRPDAVVLLQPTSPLRIARHVDEAIRLFVRRRLDSVVSVVEIPHAMTPACAMTLGRSGLLSPLPKPGSALRRQDKRRYHARNGPAILVVKTSLVEQGRLYGPKTGGYVMDRVSSVDVDGPEDLRLADLFYRTMKRR